MTRAKASMALFFIKAAYRFYVQTRKFEEANSYPNEDFNADAIGGIISACSFLECYINEIYVAVQDEDFYSLGTIPKEKIELIQKLWDRKIPRTARFGILEKYEIFLDLVGAEQFDKGRFPYQDASILVDIRNELVHYEPRWTYYKEEQDSNENSGHAKLEVKLRSKFEPSKMHHTEYFAFPHYCLSSTCLNWAFNASKEFALEFSNKVGIRNMVTSFDWKTIE